MMACCFDLIQRLMINLLFIFRDGSFARRSRALLLALLVLFVMIRSKIRVFIWISYLFHWIALNEIHINPLTN